MSENYKLSLQVIKFVLVGVLNTAIDFVVLNILILVFEPGNNTGLYTVLKSLSFIVAVVNSYCFNKYWVFRPQTSDRSDLIRFFVISIIGFVLNVTTASIIFALFAGVFESHVQLVANIGAVAGTCIVLFWNFIGYKFFVFRIKNS